MKFRFFTLPALDPAQAEEELNRFCAQHRVISIEKQCIQAGESSFWSICVCYQEQAGDIVSGRRGKVDYKEVLNEKDFALFAKLRTLRKTLSEQEGVPAYALFTNEQLAEMVRGRVTSRDALDGISGVGTARIEKYGAAFLELLQAEFLSSIQADHTHDETDTH